MVTKLTRAVERQTAEVDQRTRRPIIIRLEAGGRILKLRAKGSRGHYVVTVAQLWLLGAKNRAVELRLEKEQKRKARRDTK